MEEIMKECTVIGIVLLLLLLLLHPPPHVKAI